MLKNKDRLNGEEPFGERLARPRNDSGYSQRDVEREKWVSQRMIAYYEKQAQYPPTHVLPVLAKSLGVSVDQLLGIEESKGDGKKRDKRLWRRFSQIEKLDAKEKLTIMQLLDIFIENELLKQKAQVQ